MVKGYLYDNGDELISREEIDGLPDASEASQGDVLSLDSDKKPVWSAPSGGGGGAVILKENRNGTPISILDIDYYPVVFADSNLPVSWTNVNDYLMSGTAVYLLYSTENRNFMIQITDTLSGYDEDYQEYHYTASSYEETNILTPENVTELSKNDPLYLKIER